MKEYNKENINIARTLRKNMTVFERKLWYEFLKDYPVRFQRQKPIGNYIVDFYCAKARLVIELDGKGHNRNSQAIHDIQRATELENMNLEILRIPNPDIINKFNTICLMIDAFVKKKVIEQR